MSFTVVIPARYASTRLPGKPLLDIGGKPMIQRVFERSLESDASAVYIATDDQRVYECAKSFTDNVCLTADTHQSGTDRIQEVASQLKLSAEDVIVNVQGDEPLIPPAAINQVAHNLLLSAEAGVASLFEDIHSLEEWQNPNAVKVVVEQSSGLALYFSRSPLPWRSAESAQQLVSEGQAIAKRHIGIYAYRVSTLNNYVQWSQTELEKAERLEQLRAMSHGVRIHMARAEDNIPAGVDTPEDLENVRRYIEQHGEGK
ncbi:MAG: 3-deoxy-manno-octulosonate cytidylyltransferase [Pseudohongiellaceae bacterium]|nr:3-deoxy-manno-octulosonate cytidylyltransferase [Pseudohongiellaceae bacterium]